MSRSKNKWLWPKSEFIDAVASVGIDRNAEINLIVTELKINIGISL